MEDGRHRRGTARVSATEPTFLTALGDGMLFLKKGPSYQLWRSDGTDAGTVPLLDAEIVVPDAAEVEPLIRVGNVVYFTASNNTGYKLWKSDGTVAGTGPVVDLKPGTFLPPPTMLGEFNGRFYFAADDGTGYKLWSTDGSSAGTTKVADVPLGQLARHHLAAVLGGALYFAGGAGTAESGVWKTDGTAAGTSLVQALPTLPTDLVASGGRLFFNERVPSTEKSNLWVSNGAPSGTTNLLTFDLIGSNMLPHAGRVFFRATTAASGTEFWSSNGTAADTSLIAEILPGSGSSASHVGSSMAVASGMLLFGANSPDTGYEPWRWTDDSVPPAPLTLRSPADAYVRDGTSATANFGTATELVVRNSGTTSSNRESYLRFDLSSAPAIGSAVLRLNGRIGDTSSPSILTTVYSIDDTTWGEGALTWNTKPVAGLTNRGAIRVSGTAAAWYELDLATFLKAEKAAGRSAVTLVLRNGSATSAQTIFASDEAAANRPELVITPAGPPPQGLVVSASNVVVPEGGSANFTVKLAVQPAADVVVSVAKAGGGDGDLSTATTALTFTSANWNVAQTVTVNAAEDTDTINGTASFAISSDGLAGKTVNATESDNDQPPPPPPAATRRAARDAYVRGGSTYGGTNFGSSTELVVRKASTTGSTRETYLNFAISDLVANDLDTVKLRLFGRSSSSTQAVPLAVHGGGTASWTESGITYNNRPASEAAVLASGTVSGTTNAWREFDVTAYVRARREAGATGVTFVVKGTGTTDAQATFASDEHATGTSRPQLAVTVKPAGPPPQGIVVSATNVVVAEGGSGAFTVKLAVQPTSDVTVTVAKSAGGDADLSTAATTLTFTAANWDVAQTVTVNAAQDADTANGAASFTVSSTGLTTRTVTATEADDDAPPAGPVTLRAAADAYVRDGTSSATNFGAATELVVKRATTAGSTRESYLRFDLSAAPATIASAKLRLFGRLGDASTTLQTQVFAAGDTPWTEPGLTWDTRPATGPDALGTVTVAGTTAAWYELDLTAFLAAERAAGRTLVTLVLRNPTASSAQTMFNSDEASTGRPELVVG